MPLKDEHLWKYLIQQDLYTVQQFGMGVVGIGALLWAYGSVTSVFIKEVIAWIGLGGSLILWMHIYGALKDYQAFTEVLEKNNKAFFRRLYEARTWRNKGRNRFLYYRVTRLMIYFMGLVSWAWLTIILFHHELPLEILTVLSTILLLLTLLLAIYRKYKDLKTS